jgi:WhiB family transcriptional regulator, redox-sensing transcriptional regulator
MSTQTVPDEQRSELPCHVGDPDLWFADSPSDLERAKALCVDCPIRIQCLAAALDRAEPWGVWGGEILDRGSVVRRKRSRGRPRKEVVAA